MNIISQHCNRFFGSNQAPRRVKKKLKRTNERKTYINNIYIYYLTCLITRDIRACWPKGNARTHSTRYYTLHIILVYLSAFLSIYLGGVFFLQKRPLNLGVDFW